ISSGVKPASANIASVCSPSAATKGLARASAAENRNGGVGARKRPPLSLVSAEELGWAHCGGGAASLSVRGGGGGTPTRSKKGCTSAFGSCDDQASSSSISTPQLARRSG